MTQIHNGGTIIDVTTSDRLGALTSPDPGSVNGQLATIKTSVDGVELLIGDNSTTPPANSLQDRLASLISSLGIAASPTANSLQDRLQKLVDALANGVASPVANSLQARVQSILDAVGVVASPVANSLQARVQLIADRIGDFTTPAAGTLIARVASLVSGLGAVNDAQATSDTGSFSAISLLKLIAARLNAEASTSTTNTTVAVGTTSISLGSLTGKGGDFYNPGPNPIYVRIGGSAASASSFTFILPAQSTLIFTRRFSGAAYGILQAGTTAQNVQATIYS